MTPGLRLKQSWRRLKVTMEASAIENLKEEVIDVTFPSKKNRWDIHNSNTIALDEVERIFVGMGYEVVEGRR